MQVDAWSLNTDCISRPNGLGTVLHDEIAIVMKYGLESAVATAEFLTSLQTLVGVKSIHLTNRGGLLTETRLLKDLLLLIDLLTWHGHTTPDVNDLHLFSELISCDSDYFFLTHTVDSSFLPDLYAHWHAHWYAHWHAHWHSTSDRNYLDLFTAELINSDPDDFFLTKLINSSFFSNLHSSKHL